MIWHSDTTEAVLQELQTDRTRGLSAETAANRLQEHGPNVLQEKKPRTFFQRFLDQMKSAMVIILLIAALVSIGLNIYHMIQGESGDWVEPIVIVAIVLLNALLGVIQESKAEAALQALKNMSAPSARVWRDGALQVISSHELVPGDIVEMEAGDLIPADCRLLDASAFKCDESALTGESLPVDKLADADVPDIAPLGDRINMAYSGCIVSYGKATATVVETGVHTEMGKIAAMLENEKQADTPLQEKLEQLGKKLGFLALGICVVIFAIGLIDKLNVMDMFMTSVSLAVAAIPEGLPAIVTIVLAIGVQRMVSQNAIVRRLPAVETLGCASVICSDKTGTLTQNRMTLMQAYAGGRLVDLNGQPPEGVLALVKLATLCTDGSVTVKDGKETAIGDPTETAIISYALHHGMDKQELIIDHPRIGEIPFDSDRKLMTAVHVIEGKNVVIVKGAPDILLSRCDGVEEQPVLEANRQMAEQALRVLAVGYKYIEEMPSICEPADLESGLSFAGLLGMIDPPRPEVRDAIEKCKTAGIRTVMITGDHIVTAAAIARDLGILDDNHEAITGAQLEQLSDEELAQNIDRYRVYARVTPSDKIRIVKAWQQAGEIVSMTGDGVNDAPALKAADIGCAMGITGTDVAKGAADIVLMDDNFTTIVASVQRGRGIYDNIRKAVHFLLSCNFGEIVTVFLAMLFWRESPLMPIQLLWINLVTDSLPALALGMEPVEYDVMNRKPRGKNESIFAHGLGVNAIWQGTMIGLLSLVAYYLGSRGLSGGALNIPLGETMAFAVLAFSQLVHALNLRSSHSLFRIGLHSNWYMVGAFAASALLMVAVLLIPVLQGVFELTSMTGAQWGLCALLALVPFVVMELYKGVRSLIHFLKTRRRGGDDRVSS